MLDEIKEKKRRGQLKALLDSMVEGVIVLDAQGKIILLNASIESIFGFKEEEFLEHPLIEAIRNPELDKFLKEVLESRRIRELELEMVSPVEKIFKIRAVFYGKQDEEIRGLLVIFNDMTALRKLERSKAEFVANVSHELRTPLASIKGFVETLRDGGLEDKKNSIRFLEIIESNVTRLELLINDILELSKMDSGKIALNKKGVNLKVLVEKTLEIMKPLIKKKNLAVEVKLDAKYAEMRADQGMLEQVFLNLLDNAVKFNKYGGLIKISGEIIESMYKVSVSDTGMGIPAEDLPRIFERFYRVDKGRAREPGGTGLGLSIVKHIIELHGGTVEVKSKNGEGSIFSFTLPKAG